MGTMVDFKSKSGDLASGWLETPLAEGKAPALVLVQEWWGVNDHIKDVARRLAAEGFVVVAVDLFHGKTTKDANEAAQLMTALDKKKAVDELAGAVAWVKDQPRSTGKVGVIGFCMGGAMSFATAAACGSAVSAAVAFYGIPQEASWANVAAPILAHFGKKDHFVTPDKAERVKKELEAAGKSIELHFYDADHAFFNDTRPEVYDPKSAKLAWDRSIAFLRKHLA